MHPQAEDGLRVPEHVAVLRKMGPRRLKLSRSTGARLNRLTKLYPKPLEGEEIPVTVLEVEVGQIGWSPQDKKSVYVDESADVGALKRVRKVNRVRVFNWLSGGEGLIELSDEEMEPLRVLLETKNGEQLIYTRVKVKGKLKPRFTLASSDPPRWLLSERL